MYDYFANSFRVFVKHYFIIVKDADVFRECDLFVVCKNCIRIVIKKS